MKRVELGLFENGTWSYTVSCGKKLAVFLNETTEIWYAVEKCKGGEIWGRFKDKA